MAGVSPDPLAPLVGLPGVADAVRRAREAVVALHRHPVNRTGWAASAAEAALRAARASAALDGAELARADGVVTDPVLAGAVRAAEATGRLLGTWRTAPLQALARLHVLAAADLGAAYPAAGLGASDVAGAHGAAAVSGAPDAAAVSGAADAHGTSAVSGTHGTSAVSGTHGTSAVSGAAGAGDSAGAPGRPVRGTERLALLAELVTGGTSVPAPVLVAVVHGELLVLEPFASANGVVARAAARLAAISSGLDPRGLAVPEVGHLRAGTAYREAARGFAAGTPDGLAAWIRHCCDQWVAGAREGRSIADARAK
jgi:hypothetical protein